MKIKVISKNEVAVLKDCGEFICQTDSEEMAWLISRLIESYFEKSCSGKCCGKNDETEDQPINDQHEDFPVRE